MRPQRSGNIRHSQVRLVFPTLQRLDQVHAVLDPSRLHSITYQLDLACVAVSRHTCSAKVSTSSSCGLVAADPCYKHDERIKGFAYCGFGGAGCEERWVTSYRLEPLSIRAVVRAASSKQTQHLAS